MKEVAVVKEYRLLFSRKKAWYFIIPSLLGMMVFYFGPAMISLYYGTTRGGNLCLASYLVGNFCGVTGIHISQYRFQFNFVYGGFSTDTRSIL